MAVGPRMIFTVEPRSPCPSATEQSAAFRLFINLCASARLADQVGELDARRWSWPPLMRRAAMEVSRPGQGRHLLLGVQRTCGRPTRIRSPAAFLRCSCCRRNADFAN
jgi:hypothetical protein